GGSSLDYARPDQVGEAEIGSAADSGRCPGLCCRRPSACGLVRLFIPKGWDSIAQGSALGSRGRRMRVSVYEYLTAVGLGRDPWSPDHGMYREGRAMLDAVAGDFARIPGVEVELWQDSTEEDHEHAIWQVAERCDRSVIIAPELGGELERCCWSIWTSAGRLLGPAPEAVRLTSDKLALADHWRAHGVPTPATTDREPTACEDFPVVWKPRDGAGSTATFLLRDALDVRRVRSLVAAGEHTGPMILQEFVPGRAASVAFLCGPAGNVP